MDSRPIEDSNAIRRRRMCDVCGRRFTTYEKVETIPLIVIKKDMNREQYDRSKIETGILRACHKRPVSAEKINEMVKQGGDGAFQRRGTRDSKLCDRREGHALLKKTWIRWRSSVCVDLPPSSRMSTRSWTTEKDARQIAGGQKWKCRTILNAAIRCRSAF